MEDTWVPDDVAALRDQVQRLEQDGDELRVWVAGLEARQALVAEMLLVAELRTHLLLPGLREGEGAGKARCKTTGKHA